MNEQWISQANCLTLALFCHDAPKVGGLTLRHRETRTKSTGPDHSSCKASAGSEPHSVTSNHPWSMFSVPIARNICQPTSQQ
ncbi:Uncharacterized protein HZ326_7531 [Fusarium oxysporum f. sp. albedinis]|nr:Uncharacterized protein HZ326_7531 [Fusarium oxysporum f. sp. albedinis]